MKKISYIIGMSAALLAVSCSIEENKLEQPSASQGPKLTLTGYTHPATKVSIGEKDGEKYPLLWGTGDAIAIWSKDVTTTPGEGDAEDVITGKIQGEQAELYSGDAGKSSGVFQTNNSFSVESDEEIVITYPASALKYTDGKITGTLTEMQEQRSANSSIHVGNNALAFAETTLKANQTDGVTFTLEQKTAFVKVILTTSEFSSLNLVSAKLYSPESRLSGKMEYDLATKQMTVTETKNSVGAKLRTPAPFSGTQELYFTALPCDLTGKDTWLIVTMSDESKTVTIPAKITGGELRESCLSVISLSNISTATNECEWYDPVEVRDLVDGWAYGPQNTYFVESKASGEGETSLKINVKARGDFSKVGIPKYYGLMTASSEMGTRKFLHLPNNVNTYEPNPTNTVNSDWTIDVYAYDQSQTGHWAVVALYDENYKVLWSYMICKYLSGDDVKSVEYPGTGITLMDRTLGEVFSSTKALQTGKFENSYAYFQWGRKDPFGWSNSNMTQYSMTFAPEGSDISVAIEHPSIVYAFKSETLGDWQYKEHRTDLWGGVNNTLDWYDPNGVGHKTIYDPCPEGYRVPDAKVFAEVGKTAEIWEVNINKPAMQPEENINPDSPFTAAGISVLAYPLGNGQYDYWPYGGARFGNQENWGNRTQTNKQHGCIYWANSVDPNATQQAIMIEYCYFSTAYNQNTRHAANRGQSFPIRCQKEQ